MVTGYTPVRLHIYLRIAIFYHFLKCCVFSVEFLFLVFIDSIYWLISFVVVVVQFCSIRPCSLFSPKFFFWRCSFANFFSVFYFLFHFLYVWCVALACCLYAIRYITFTFRSCLHVPCFFQFFFQFRLVLFCVYEFSNNFLTFSCTVCFFFAILNWFYCYFEYTYMTMLHFFSFLLLVVFIHCWNFDALSPLYHSASTYVLSPSPLLHPFSLVGCVCMFV